MENIRIITHSNPHAPIAEAFRTLRTNIQFSNIDKDMKTLVITSGSPSEGKSTVASNLAYTMGQENKKVLLIDCDMRKPTIHKAFRISNILGLTDILLGEKTMDEVVYQGETDVGGLHVVTSGPIPPNPAELLNSKRMKNFLKEMEEEFDTIILDAPPIGLVTDAAVLSTIVDGVILVTAVGEADLEATKRAKELLDKVKANIIGVVLNKIPIKGINAYRYGYYKYGGYYGQEEEPKKKSRRRGRKK